MNADWQPIETAPFRTDSFGNRWLDWCLLFVPDANEGVIIVGGMDAGMWLWRDDVRSCGEFKKEPTRWRPLPSPPTAEEGNPQ